MTNDAILHQTFLLLILFQIKHFVADFPLQFPYMLRKYSAGWDFIVPLATHCAVHAGLTLAITLVFQPALWWLAIVDFALHFMMDRIKSGPRYLGRWNDTRKTAYWVAMGFDQMFHHLTHLYLIWIIVTHQS